MYHRVYAPNGEPFDVTRDRADRLILQEGWTQSKPKAVAREPEPAQNEADSIQETDKPRPRKRKAVSDVLPLE